MAGRTVRRRGRFLVAAAMVAGAVVATIVSGPSDAASGDLVTLPAPARLVDTREGAPTIDGAQAGTGRLAAGSTFDVQVTGRAGVPSDAAVVVLTVTAVDPIDAGFLTVHGTGIPRPNASNVNYVAGQNIANTVIARIGGAGRVSIFTFAAVDLAVDVTGYFPAGGPTMLSAPARLVDTREGASTIDGQQVGVGLLAPDSTLDVRVTGRAGVPATAEKVILTVTAVDPLAIGFLTAHPTGTARPNASNVNYEPGQTIANLVVSAVGTDGRVSIYTSERTDLVVDVAGWFDDGGYSALPTPARIADLRFGASTVDGLLAGGDSIDDGRYLQVPVAGRAGVPADASAVVLNVAAVPGRSGFLTVHPRGTDRPTASNLNYRTGRITANTVIARIGDAGDVCIFASRNTQLIVDVSGFFRGPAPAATGPDCPEPIVAAWPAPDVVFATPEAAAGDFVEKVLGVPPQLSAFRAGDANSGEIDVMSQSLVRGTLIMRRFGPAGGWFVVFGNKSNFGFSTGMLITLIDGPSDLRGPITVRGVGQGFERTISVRAYAVGVVPPFDTAITAGGLTFPEPYSADLDLSGAAPGSVVAIVAQGDTGLAGDPGFFAVSPVLILS